MAVSRRDFIRGGVSAFTIGFAAPAFLSDLARAQGARARNLVIVYLGGGNDALSTVVPYQDPFYYSRRPNISIPAGQVLQIGSDSSGKALGLHPRLGGLRELYNSGRLAIVQRTGYLNSSRSHFQGKDIWDTANPTLTESEGWLGRYLETVPVDPLSGWSTTQELPRALMSRDVSVPSIPNAAAYSFSSFNAAEAANERLTATRIASHVPAGRPHLAFVNTSAQAAFATIDRVRRVVRLHRNGGLSEQRIRAGAADRRRSARARNRHPRVLGADRRVRHARGPGQPGRRQPTPT